MTRVTSGAGVAGTAFPQTSAQGSIANAIATLGTGAALGTGSSFPGGDSFYDSNPAPAGAVVGTSAVTINDGYSSSYHQVGEQNSSNPQSINFGGDVDILDNGPIEAVQGGSGAVFSSLYDVPESGHGSEIYLGYFTFDPNGELTYTAVSAVPEPSTYGMLAGAGLLALVFRRQFRRLAA